MRAFKIAEEDFTLRDCDHNPLLFKNMFPDSSICRSFSISKSKVSYIFQDGLGPLLLKWTYQSVHRSSSCFAIMFDETTTDRTKDKANGYNSSILGWRKTSCCNKISWISHIFVVLLLLKSQKCLPTFRIVKSMTFLA